jgi:hypothetical protein
MAQRWKKGKNGDALATAQRSQQEKEKGQLKMAQITEWEYNLNGPKQRVKWEYNLKGPKHSTEERNSNTIYAAQSIHEERTK